MPAHQRIVIADHNKHAIFWQLSIHVTARKTVSALAGDLVFRTVLAQSCPGERRTEFGLSFDVEELTILAHENCA